MDLFVWQTSEASSSKNPFETPTEQREQYGCVGQKKNWWWWKLPLISKSSATSHGHGTLGTAIGSWIDPVTSEKWAPPISLRLDAPNWMFIRMYVCRRYFTVCWLDCLSPWNTIIVIMTYLKDENLAQIVCTHYTIVYKYVECKFCIFKYLVWISHMVSGIW